MILNIEKFKVLPILLAFMIVGVACSAEDSDQQWTAPETVKTSAEVKSQDPNPVVDPPNIMYNPNYNDITNAGNFPQGGNFVRLYSDPPTLDPHTTSDSTSSTVIVEIFGGLITIDPHLNFVPDLAESWEITSGGRVYTFKLNPAAKFHDGRSVFAEDVKWSFERAADPNTKSVVAKTYLGDIVGVAEKLSGKKTDISGIQVLDPLTIRIEIDSPKAYFLAKLTYPTAFVLDRFNVQADPTGWMLNPNGTGPFMLSSYVPGEHMTLTKNNFYHLGPPNVDTVELILSGGSGLIMYENDEIHITGIGIDDLDRALDPTSEIAPDVVQSPPSFSVNYIGMNVNEPPFDDPKVRRALNMAINKQAIAETLYSNLIIPAKSILPPGFPGHDPSINPYSYDPDAALALLKSSKYGDDISAMPPITLSIPGGFGAPVDLDLEVILQDWEQVLGLTVNIQQTEWATFLQDLNKQRFQMFKVGWISDYPDPENFLDVLFHSDSPNNHTGYSSPSVDSLLVKARTDNNIESRFQLYTDAENQILSDSPWIPLWNNGEGYLLIKPEVKNYFLTPLTIPKMRFIYFDNSPGS